MQNSKLRFVIAVLAIAIGELALDGVAIAQESATITKIKGLSPDAKASAMLPEKMRAAGALKLATDAHYPPCESFAEDGKTMVGWEPDFWTAIGQILGVRVDAESTAFAGLIPGVASARYDVAMECITDTVERQKQVTFVDVMRARSAAVTLESNHSTDVPLWFCGRKTGTQQGTTFAQYIDKIMTPACQSANKPAVENGIYPSADAAMLALYSGRVDFVVNNQATINELRKKAPQPIKMVPIEQFPTNFTGMIVAKENGQLADALLEATKVMQREGVYDQIATKWALEGLKLDQPGLNLAGR